MWLKKNIQAILFFMLITAFWMSCGSQENRRYPGVESVPDFHPSLAHLQPIAIAENDSFYIYAADSLQREYHFVKRIPTPMDIPKGIRASFPLSGYHNQPACIVTPEVFDTRTGYVTTMHEFVHCYQYETCEPALKAQLQVYQDAMAAKCYSWEIDYDFPYSDSQFVTLYANFLAALDQEDISQINHLRKQLCQQLAPKDYEYMVWQEWKEGLACYLENQMQTHLDLEINRNGLQQSYGRVSFYAGGARFIAYLLDREPGLTHDIKALFYHMLNYHQPQLSEG